MNFDAYCETGFDVHRQLVSGEEVGILSAAIDQLWSDWSSQTEAVNVMWRNHSSGERRPDRLDPAWPHSLALDSLIHNETLVALAREYLNDEPVVFKDKLVMRYPGMQGYDAHQEFPYWADYGAEPGDFVQILLAVDAANETNGAVEFCPGLHDEVLPAPPDDPFDIDPAVLSGCEWVMPALEPGDAVIFHSLAPHRSSVNLTDTPRRAYYMTYVTAAIADTVLARRDQESSVARRRKYTKLTRHSP